MYVCYGICIYVHTYMGMPQTWQACIYVCVCKSPIYSCIFTCPDIFSCLINTHFYHEVAYHGKLPFLVSADNWGKRKQDAQFPSACYSFLYPVALTVIHTLLCFVYFSLLSPAFSLDYKSCEGARLFSLLFMVLSPTSRVIPAAF